jgi:Sulfatase
LTLIGLGALAVSQPILSDLRAGAGYFVARRVEPLDIVVLVVVITLAPGVVANLLISVAGVISKGFRKLTQAGIVGMFVALLLLTFALRVVSPPWAAVLIPIAIGAIAAVVYYRSEWLRDGLVWLSAVPLAIAGFFLFTPPVVHLVVPPSVAAVEAGVESKAPVVFIVFDELPLVSLLDRAGEMDVGRYPNFAALAETSTWYKYAATAHDLTLWAIPALLTGGPPDQSLVPTTANYPGNLFTLLDRSHELNVVESHTYLCPSEMCGETQPPTRFWQRFSSLIGDAVRLYAMIIAPDPSALASVSNTFEEALAEAEASADRESIPDRRKPFEAFLHGITSADSRLYYAHLPLPHIPYQYYPSGRQYIGWWGLEGQEGELWFDQALAEQGYQRHLFQVEYVDRLLGQLLDRLEEVGILDEAILVVTADHGASFRADTPRRALVDSNAFEIAMVPLFIKAPHQSSGIVETTPARTIDVLPTVAAYLGIELPWPHQGRSLTGTPRPAPTLQVKAYWERDLVELDDVEEGVFDAIEYAYSIFGDGMGRINPSALGDYDALIGRAPEEVATGSSGLDVQVEDLWRLDHVSESIDFLPGFVRGEIVGDVGPDVHIAIALNGLIRTVVPVMEADGTSNFSAILPEHAFEPGFNDLTLMAVTGPIDSPMVESIELDGQKEFQLDPGESGEPEHLVDNEGRRWEVTKEPVINGLVEGTNWYPNEVVTSRTDLAVVGWAVDTLEVRPVERVAFFVDGIYGGSVAPDVERPDVQRGYDDAGTRFSGFRGEVSHFLQAESCELRAFALSGGNAFELDTSERARSTFLGC